jgi:hypothetical protein
MVLSQTCGWPGKAPCQRTCAGDRKEPRRTKSSLGAGQVFSQRSTPSESVRASSMSTPRQRTVLSIFVCPSNSCTALRLPVFVWICATLVRRIEWVRYALCSKPSDVSHPNPRSFHQWVAYKSLDPGAVSGNTFCLIAAFVIRKVRRGRRNVIISKALIFYNLVEPGHLVSGICSPKRPELGKIH